MSQLLLASIHEQIDREVAVTDWVAINQTQVNIFGEVTHWTPKGHVDPAWAAEHSPYGGTLIHGFFMVSLVTHFLELGGLRFPDGENSLNYGMDRVRILQPVVVGDGIRLRDRIRLLEVTDRDEGRRLIKTAHRIECDGMEGPVAYIEYLNLWHRKG